MRARRAASVLELHLDTVAAPARQRRSNSKLEAPHRHCRQPSASRPWCGDSFHRAHAHRRVVGGREYDAGDGGRAQAARLSPLGALISCVVTPRAAHCGPSIQPPQSTRSCRLVRTAVSSRPLNIFSSAEHRNPGRYTQDNERKQNAWSRSEIGPRGPRGTWSLVVLGWGALVGPLSPRVSSSTLKLR